MYKFVYNYYIYSLSSLERSLSERLDFFLRLLGLRDLDLCLRDRDLDRCRCLERRNNRAVNIERLNTRVQDDALSWRIDSVISVSNCGGKTKLTQREA